MGLFIGGIPKYIDYLLNIFVRVMFTLKSEWPHLSVRIYGIRNASTYILFMSSAWRSDVLQSMCLKNVLLLYV